MKRSLYKSPRSPAARHATRRGRVWAALVGMALLPAVVVAQDSDSTISRASHASRTDTYVLQTDEWIDPSGQLVAGGLVVIRNGAIVQVGGDPPAGTEVHAYPGAVLCPGLIDCQAALGVLDGLSERQTAIQPAVRARDAFNRYSSQLGAALTAGVTTFALAPDDQNLIGGRIAVCQTSGPDGRPRVLTGAGPLKLSLAPASFKRDREPTSRGGALGLLRETLEAARQEPLAQDSLTEFAAGRLAAVIAVPSGADVLSALQLTEEYGLQLTLVHTHDAQQVAEHVAEHGRGVIVGPLDLESTWRAAIAPGLFEQLGAPVALAGGLPTRSADSLRIGAAVAARAGLSAPAARRAITAVPAEFLGVGDRIGSIDSGYQADLVVFSGDPLDLRVRVLAVYVAGRRVFVADPPGAQGEQR